MGNMPPFSDGPAFKAYLQSPEYADDIRKLIAEKPLPVKEYKVTLAELHARHTEMANLCFGFAVEHIKKAEKALMAHEVIYQS